jgi:hypothetical protein
MRSADILYTSSWTPTVQICSGSLNTVSAFLLDTGMAEVFTSAVTASSRAITSNPAYASRRQSNCAQRSLWTPTRPSVSVAPAPMPPRSLSEPPNVGIPSEKTAPRTSKTDKIALAIDSLNNYDLIKPIPVLIESLGDKVFVAESLELNVSTTGDSVGAAFLLLKEQIITTYEGYRGRKGSDSERARQLAVFDQYIGKPRRHWF